MYALNRAPSKLATKASRRGPINTFEKESRCEHHHGPVEMSSPRPVFNGKRNFGRSNSNNTNYNNPPPTNEPISQNHEENVRYISEMWQHVWHEYEVSKRQGRQDGPEMYQEKQVANALQDFEPFNFDQWILERSYAKTQQQ